LSTCPSAEACIWRSSRSRPCRPRAFPNMLAKLGALRSSGPSALAFKSRSKARGGGVGAQSVSGLSAGARRPFISYFSSAGNLLCRAAAEHLPDRRPSSLRDGLCVSASISPRRTHARRRSTPARSATTRSASWLVSKSLGAIECQVRFSLCFDLPSYRGW